MRGARGWGSDQQCRMPVLSAVLPPGRAGEAPLRGTPLQGRVGKGVGRHRQGLQLCKPAHSGLSRLTSACTVP